PGKLGELVDCGDHERRQEAIDLLVDGDDRQPLPCRLPLSEVAIPVRAVQQCALGVVGVGTLEVGAGVELLTTPGAGDQLEWTGPTTTSSKTGVFHCLSRIPADVGGDRSSD